MTVKNIVRKILWLVAFTSIFSACGNGAETLPELSARILNALKNNNVNLILPLAPSKGGMIKAYDIYLSDKSKGPSAKREKAIDRYHTVHADLRKSFAEMEKQSVEKEINWKDAKILNFNYSFRDHKEDYKDAQVRVVLQTGKDKNVILYKAYLFGNRWYLMEQMEWEE